MPTGLALVHHDRAHERAGLIALAVDDDDVAGLGEGHRRVNHQVVARANFYRERGAGNRHRRIERLDPAMERAAPSGDVGQDRCLEAGRLRHDIGRYAFEFANDVG